ncbi:MAG: hypothetical protein ACPGJJ_02835 [Parvibaculales bacterium]
MANGNTVARAIEQDFLSFVQTGIPITPVTLFASKLHETDLIKILS